MTKVLHQYVGPLPDITRIYPTDLALSGDRTWLKDNPKAVARVRTFRDDTRTDKRVTLLTLRLLDPSSTDGWRVVHVEAHSSHWNSPAFKAWRDRPGGMMAANDAALTLLTADADTEGGHARTALGGLALPDLSELPPHWRAQFAPASRPTAHTPSEDKTMNAVFTFTGKIYEPEHDPERPTDAEEMAWLKANPTQIAHIRRIDVPLGGYIGANILLGVFEFSVRVLDPREQDGWRLARFELPAMAYSLYATGLTIGEVWDRSVVGRIDLENGFVVNALKEAAYTGEVWAGVILRSLVVPDTSELNPEAERHDFTLYDPKATV